MKKVLLAALLSIAAVSANATVLTFDDVPGAHANRYGVINPNASYHGFSFKSSSPYSYFSSTYWMDTVGSNYNYGAHSGEFTMLSTGNGHLAVKAFDNADFTFNGVWAATWGRYPSRNVTISGYNNGAMAWSSVGVLTPTFSHFAGANGLIDELRISAGSAFLIDDLALNEVAQAEVPEPGSLALLGLGLAGFALTRRRKQA